MARRDRRLRLFIPDDMKVRDKEKAVGSHKRLRSGESEKETLEQQEWAPAQARFKDW